jgi:hypothetical protein
MLWLRMALVVFRLTWPYLLAPWRSPLLRWRMETYGILDRGGRLLHAEEITFPRCVAFSLSHRQALWRFLRWAADL